MRIIKEGLKLLQRGKIHFVLRTKSEMQDKQTIRKNFISDDGTPPGQIR